MFAVITRVGSASVEIDGALCADMGRGLLVLLGVMEGDTGADAEWLARKVCAMRIFSDEAGKMNLSLADVGGGITVVSNFTLAADCRKGNRPSFVGAAEPGEAERLYEYFAKCCRGAGFEVQTGRFGADMKVASVNDGPVTIPLDSRVRFAARRSQAGHEEGSK